MIKSILDSDLYKFSMSYAYMQLYPEAEGRFVFNDRNKEVYNQEFLKALKMELAKLCGLRLTKEEFAWLENGAIRYIPLSYWEWLRQFTFDTNKINVFLDEEQHLQIEVVDKMYKATLYEVPILAIVSELRNKFFEYNANGETMHKKLVDKINFANEHQLYFSEFGTRRRYSSNSHEMIVATLKEKCPIYCTGTSNVYFAYKFGMKPIGTMAHEFIMLHGALGGYKKANQRAIENWQRVYHGALGTALIDTYTTKAFLNEFTCELAKLFDGVRQDSGDEIMVGNMIIDRYRELGIDPTTKTIIFSNALDMQMYERIARYFKGQIRVGAGIGTNLTCDTDLEGYKPANIVMKLAECRVSKREPWQKCIKISDDLGKHMGDDKEVEICKYQLGLE